MKEFWLKSHKIDPVLNWKISHLEFWNTKIHAFFAELWNAPKKLRYQHFAVFSILVSLLLQNESEMDQKVSLKLKTRFLCLEEKKGGTRSIFCFVGLKAANVAQVFRICQTLRVFVEPDRHKKTCPTLRMRCLRKRDSWLAKKLVEGLFLCIIAVMVTFSAGIRQIGKEKCILDYIIELNVWLC